MIPSPNTFQRLLATQKTVIAFSSFFFAVIVLAGTYYKTLSTCMETPLLSPSPAITGSRFKQLHEVSNYKNAYCLELDVQLPRRQPCWGASELERRRKNVSNVGNLLLPRGMDDELIVIATDKNGNFIFPSEGGLDRWLHMHHFRYLDRPVFYADFGSNDPIFTSNTFFLDFCMKASGVCVEPTPSSPRDTLHIDRAN